MSAGLSFRIHVHEASGLPKPSLLNVGGSNVYVSLRVDEQKCTKSPVVSSSPVAKFDFQYEVSCPSGARFLHLEVKRPHLLGKATGIGGCALHLDQVTSFSQQSLPIWDPTTKAEVGRLLVSVQLQDGRLPGGLVNQASNVSFLTGDTMVATSSQNTKRTIAREQSSLSNTTAVTGHGGLVNHAATGAFTSSSRSESAIGFPSEAPMTPRGLVNHAGDQPGLTHAGSCEIGADVAPATGGLANQAEASSGGVRQNALPRAQEILEALTVFKPSDEDHVRKLRQAVEELRHAPEPSLKTKDGKAAFSSCCTFIEVLFQATLIRHDEKGANGALWLAGRLPSMGDDGEARAKLQESLRSQWDKAKLDQALQQSRDLLPKALNSREALGELMDMLDLAEFHATQVAGADSQKYVGEILKQLQPRLKPHLETLLSRGCLEEAEDLFDVIGAARVESLHLHKLQKELQQQRSVGLLRQALVPMPSEVGFSLMRQRQLRHAVMTVRTAMAEDATGSATTAVKNLLFVELLPTTLAHANKKTAVETTEALLQTVSMLRLSFDEVWAAAQRPFEGAPAETRTAMAKSLQQKCKELSVASPPWLLSPKQVECRRAIQVALNNGTAEELQAALVKVKDTEEGREACRTEWNAALEKLRAQHRLPQGWDVESMLDGQAKERKLLAKHELSQGHLLPLFDKLLKSTTHEVWTRDRRGKVPKSYSAVRAIEVRNAENWSTYLGRRDEIAKACTQLGKGARWDEGRDGSLLTEGPVGLIAQQTNAPALLKDANEVWLLHGTSHEAAEAISSQDFDMARASPTGLFGAGIYFAESISKSDEYVMGKSLRGKELFPLLICRVCLGHMYYCDEKAPDRKRLEERCIKENWHSVLGDRKKISGTFREFVVYDNLQAFPAFLVYYTREY